MSRGLRATLNVLATTATEAVVPVLLAALDSSQREFPDQALTILLTRRSPLAEREILSRWNGMSHRWKAQVAARVGWLSAAARQAILGADADLFANGCAAAL